MQLENEQYFTFFRTELCIHGCTVYHTTCSWIPDHSRQSRSWRTPRSPSSVPPSSNLMDKDIDDLPLVLVMTMLPSCSYSSLTPTHCVRCFVLVICLTCHNQATCVHLHFGDYNVTWKHYLCWILNSQWLVINNINDRDYPSITNEL